MKTGNKINENSNDSNTQYETKFYCYSLMAYVFKLVGSKKIK